MKFKEFQQVEVRHLVESGEQEWWPGMILELMFQAGKKCAMRDYRCSPFKGTVGKDLYLVEAEFPSGKLHKVPRLARDIRPVQAEEVLA